jgi:hypothetical protein
MTAVREGVVGCTRRGAEMGVLGTVTQAVAWTGVKDVLGSGVEAVTTAVAPSLTVWASAGARGMWTAMQVGGTLNGGATATKMVAVGTTAVAIAGVAMAGVAMAGVVDAAMADVDHSCTAVKAHRQRTRCA